MRALWCPPGYDLPADIVHRQGTLVSGTDRVHPAKVCRVRLVLRKRSGRTRSSCRRPYIKAMFIGGLKVFEMSDGDGPHVVLQVHLLHPGDSVSAASGGHYVSGAKRDQGVLRLPGWHLDPTKAIGLANFAEQLDCETLKQQSNLFIARNFTKVSIDREVYARP